MTDRNRRCFGCGKEILNEDDSPKELVYRFYKKPAFVLIGISPIDLECAKVFYDCGFEIYCAECYNKSDLKIILEGVKEDI